MLGGRGAIAGGNYFKGMRLIGHIGDRLLAERASALLTASGIGHRVEAEEGRGWGIWVLSEEDMGQGRELYAAFVQAPDDPRFRAMPVAGSVAVPPAEPAAGKQAGAGVPGQEASRAGMATVAIVLLCGVGAMVSALGENREWVNRMIIAGLPYRWGAAWDLFLPEVRAGQAWRLITPIFLHFGWPHITFNLLAFWGLGNAIEGRRGTWPLVGLVIAFGLFSNLGQYFARGPLFGGLSGVVYGLLGYVWMLGRYRPSSGLVLQPQVVVMMLVWFAICVNGSLDTPYGRGADGLMRPAQGVANAAHGIGLLAGVIWGRWVAWREAERGGSGTSGGPGRGGSG
jgi:GlpG protein